jgi:hypothetical protein
MVIHPFRLVAAPHQLLNPYNWGWVFSESIGLLSSRLSAHKLEKVAMSWMARVLSRMVVKENRGLLGILVAGKPEAVRASRDKDVDYLAPLLVEGLTRAASDQQVGFRVVQTGVPAESTKGSLYAYGRSLPNLSPLFLSPLVEFSG